MKTMNSAKGRARDEMALSTRKVLAAAFIMVALLA